jgi:peptidoglycan/xylan/chitin deacetylase (PgdA/CDA1 family)
LFLSPEPLILCYHAVSNRWDAPLAVTVAAFAEQIAALAARGYRGATFTEIARRGGDARTVAVTFDDGYKSVKDLALPILEEHGFPATVFVPTELVRGGGPLLWPGIDHWAEDENRDELEAMTATELRELTANGWEIGSHTLTHPKLPELNDDDLRRELVDSKEQCSELTGVPCTSIAFPYGAVDYRVLDAAEEAGYEAGALLSSVLVRPTPFAFDRVGIYRADTMRSFRAKTSPLLRRLPERARRGIKAGGRALPRL